MTDLHEDAERLADETMYPHKRFWRLAKEFRPMLQAYGRVWEKQAGALSDRGGSPMEALEEEVDEVERPILLAIAGINAEKDALSARLAEVERERDEARNQLDSARHSVEVLEKRATQFMAKLGEARARVAAAEAKCLHIMKGDDDPESLVGYARGAHFAARAILFAIRGDKT